MTGSALRRVAVRQGTRLVLTASNAPGMLRSTASPSPAAGVPPPPAPPGAAGDHGSTTPGSHPFLSGHAYDAATEDQLGGLLSQSSSFDDYLARLIKAGFDIEVTDDPAPPFERSAVLRITDDARPIGAAWAGPGYLARLLSPPSGAIPSPNLAATAYSERDSSPLLSAASSSEQLSDLQHRLTTLGWTVVCQEAPGGAT